MNKTLLVSLLALGITAVSTTAMAFEMGQSRQGRGIDNPAGHVRQGRGADNPVGHIRQGRGADDVGGARGVHADGHISGGDRVRNYGGSNGGLNGGNYGRGNGSGAVSATNPAGNERGRGRGRGRGGDDSVGQVHPGRGADNPTGHIRQGRGADVVGGTRGAHADGHISGRDRVRVRNMGAMGLVGR